MKYSNPVAQTTNEIDREVQNVSEVREAQSEEGCKTDQSQTVHPTHGTCINDDPDDTFDDEDFPDVSDETRRLMYRYIPIIEKKNIMTCFMSFVEYISQKVDKPELIPHPYKTDDNSNSNRIGELDEIIPFVQSYVFRGNNQA